MVDTRKIQLTNKPNKQQDCRKVDLSKSRSIEILSVEMVVCLKLVYRKNIHLKS